MKASDELRKLCVGHPHAKVSWPHRELHNAADLIDELVGAAEEARQALALHTGSHGLATSLPDDNRWAKSIAAENRIRKALSRARGEEGSGALMTNSNDEWRTDALPKDGTVIYYHTLNCYRFQPYKVGSQQFKRGKFGRWQKLNEYGGWDNCEQPSGGEWRTDLPKGEAE